GSRRVERGGFESELAASEALARSLERCPEQGLVQAPRLRELIDERGVARMGRVGVRAGALAFADPDEDAAKEQFERTGANGCEHRAHLPCRRSWVRVPSSASKTPGYEAVA